VVLGSFDGHNGNLPEGTLHLDGNGNVFGTAGTLFKISQLVQAMATFSVDNSASTSAIPSVNAGAANDSSLQTALAAPWHA
jgi:hypothetical protein